ncbi:MAG: hypothetical protein IJM46_05730 [Oscillospiraceae bacterium]|nr:hypothetical protein [Oscillospiraceae bacterium]
MGKQINYYMEYACFLRLAEKALELGCEIIRNEHAAEISRGFSADIVTPDCIHYYFYVPDAGELTFGTDMYGKRYVQSYASAGGNALIEAGFSCISDAEKCISRARLYCTTGYYDADKVFVPRPDNTAKIYNTLARYAKKLAPFTELTDTRISMQDETYLQEIEYIHKEYITPHCLHLRNEAYALR